MSQTNYNPDVLSCLANLSNDEVFTPPKLVNEMLDLLPVELWSNPNATFLDPVSKSGVFLREIAKRLLKGLEREIPDQQERINHIFTKQLFGIAITELTSLLSRRSVYCSKTADGKYSACDVFSDAQGNIRYKRMQHTWENGRCVYCGASQTEYDRENELETYAYNFIHTDNPENLFNMKFDVIIGNPPYQLNDGGGTGSSAMPIYHKFIEQGKRLTPRFLIMITPSRWFSGGKGLEEFREEMLNDERIREIHDHLDSRDCFNGVYIEGGVCYFLWNRDEKGLCKVFSHSGERIISISERPLLESGANVFIRYNEAIPILRKVLALEERRFSEIVSYRNPYGLGSDFFKKEADDIFSSSREVKDYYSVLGIENRNRVVKYISNKYPLAKGIEGINKWKVFISKADGAAGQVGNPIPARIIGKAEIGEPGSVCTETFLQVGTFDTPEETINANNYMKTKFFRFLVGVRKTKNMTKDTYYFAPLLDFKNLWTDCELYDRYHLTREEIEFIETMIQEME